MEYAVQTRDYNHDYKWSWEGYGSDSLRAKVSLELQNLIEDGKPGVAVVFREGSYHVILAAIYRLGDEPPIGKDSSGQRDIRLNLVFSKISLEKAKGIVNYYYNNRANPGKAFGGIVTWSATRDKWTINEEQIKAAFESIPEVPASGIVLNCENGSELHSLLDFDWGQTEGPQYVYEPKSNNPVRIAVDPIPEKPLPPPEPPKISYWKRSLLFFLLLIAACVGLGYQGVLLQQNKDKITELESRPTKEKFEDLQNKYTQLDTQLQVEIQRLKDESRKFEDERDQYKKDWNNLVPKQKALDNLQTKWEELGYSTILSPEGLRALNDRMVKSQEDLNNVQLQLNNLNDSFNKKLQEEIQNAKERYHENFKTGITNDLKYLMTKIDTTVGNGTLSADVQKEDLKNEINRIKNQIEKSDLPK